MQIERRLPFGFRGDWGMLYKLYRPEATLETPPDVDGKYVIDFEQNRYVDIGQNMQFKRVEDRTKEHGQEPKGAESTDERITVETTDAYWNDKHKIYECVVELDDIIKVFGEWWKPVKIRTHTRYVPAPLSFFYIEIKRIDRDL